VFALKILVSDALSSEGLAVLQKNADVDYKPDIKADELVAEIGAYDALVVRSRSKVTAEVIEAGINLKVIGRAGVGVDNIDLDKATEKGVVVLNAPHGNTISAAELTIALMTSLARNIPAANYSIKGGEWKRSEYTGVELYAKVLGVIGLGRIGSEVARRAMAMGMKIIAYDPYVSAEKAQKMGIEMVPFENLLKQADFLTFHMPLNPQTHHMIGEKELAMLKPDVRIINCARGGLIDEDALCVALQEGRVAGAALDVFEEEPPNRCRLLEQDNFIGTPHLGASTREAQTNVALQVAEQVIKALQGEPIVSAVNLPALLPETRKALEPYFPLMEVLGSFYLQVFGGSVDEIELTYFGDITTHPYEFLTTSCLIGFLRPIIGEGVNWVNAPYIAKERGISIRETATTEIRNYNTLVRMTGRSKGQEHRVSGTIHSDGMRLVRVDEHLIEIIPSKYMLVTTHEDRPGVVGKIGTLLGEENINIASMQLGRVKAAQKAMMFIQVDNVMSEEALNKVRALDFIREARFVILPDILAD
jgi:D-3-phosphoglycerate dehydrogenase / 2-oxoglutarate reductase